MRIIRVLMSLRLNRILTAFLGGVALATIVAWQVWPRTSPPRELDPQGRHGIVGLGEYQLSPSEHVRAFAVPHPGGLSLTICVVYLNSELRTALLSCPDHEVLDLRPDDKAQP
jgi:hypothetical protein